MEDLKALARFRDGVELSSLSPVMFIRSAMWSHEIAFLASEATSRIAKHLTRDIRGACAFACEASISFKGDQP